MQIAVGITLQMWWSLLISSLIIIGIINIIIIISMLCKWHDSTIMHKQLSKLTWPYVISARSCTRQ